MTDVTALEAAIEVERERFAVPGIGVTVVHAGQKLVCRGFGLRDVDGGLPVTEHTLFPIGSSTKAFTASVLAALVDQGLLEWDTPVREYLPGFRMHDPVATELLTPRDMLCHRSGLPRHDLLWFDNQMTRAEICRRLRFLPSSRTFRSTWQYNNLMFITAGHLTEVLLDCTWEQAVRDRLFEPLGMTNTNFSVLETQKSDDHSLPYQDKDGEVRRIPFRGIDHAGPAGSINSCPADMAQWALVNASGGVVGDKRVLSEATVREVHSTSMAMQGSDLSPIADLHPEAQIVGYGMGWFVENYRGHTIVHHGGNIDGFSAMVSVLPAEQIGVVALCNEGGTFARDVIPYVVYDQLLGLEPLPWGEWYRAAYDALHGGQKDAQAQVASKKRDVPPSHTLEEYAGEYTHPGYGSIRLRFEDGAINPMFNMFDEFEFSHRHYDVFELRLDAFDAIFPITFALDPAGDIVSCSVQFEGSLEPMIFIRQPDPILADEATLAQYVGSYEMGPMPLVVALALTGEGPLTAAVLGQQLELVPHRAGVFTVKEQPAIRFEFTVDGGTVTSVLVDPVGVFTPVVA